MSESVNMFIGEKFKVEVYRQRRKRLAGTNGYCRERLSFKDSIHEF